VGGQPDPGRFGHQLPLRTLNTDHFARVETLELETWE
jgi:predicted nucleic acid-binding protein